MSFEYFDAVAVPIFVVERLGPDDWRILRMNPAHRRCTGLKQEETDGRRLCEVMPEPVARRLQTNNETAFRNQAPMHYRQVVPLPIGERWFETTLAPASDNPAVLIGTAIDITFKVGATERRVVEASEREEFIALAARDMRAPLRQIRQFAELLREDFIDHSDGKVALVSWIEEASRRAGDLTNKILTYVLAHRDAVTKQRIPVAGLAREVLQTVDATGLCRPQVPDVKIESDPAVMLLLLRNLMDNAVKHGARQEAKIIVSVEEQAPGEIKLVFSDNGPGFQRDLPDGDLDGIALRTGFGLRALIRILRARGGSLRSVPSAFGCGAGLAATLPGRVIQGSALLAS